MLRKGALDEMGDYASGWVGDRRRVVFRVLFEDEYLHCTIVMVFRFVQNEVDRVHRSAEIEVEVGKSDVDVEFQVDVQVDQVNIVATRPKTTDEYDEHDHFHPSDPEQREIRRRVPSDTRRQPRDLKKNKTRRTETNQLSAIAPPVLLAPLHPVLLPDVIPEERTKHRKRKDSPAERLKSTRKTIALAQETLYP
jgi:hypothetical protein